MAAPEVRRITCSDGVTLHAESHGAGTPIVFVHEFAADHASWAPQVQAFARSHRVIVYAARGYPPSDVPPSPESYVQDRAMADIVEVMDGFGIERAHVVSFSMGAFAAFHLALRHPGRLRSVVLAGVGYGSPLAELDAFRREALAAADMFEREGMAKAAETYALGPARVQFQTKDHAGWLAFKTALAHRSAAGAAATMRGLQARRPSIYEFDADVAACAVPCLIVVGDEDEPALDPSLYLKRLWPACGLVVFPRTGHTINLEEPDRFNAEVFRFVSLVDAGAWPARDPRSKRKSALGVKDHGDR